MRSLPQQQKAQIYNWLQEMPKKLPYEELEKELKQKTEVLEEMNTAFKILLEQREKIKKRSKMRSFLM